MKKLLILPFCISLFDEAGGAAEGAAAQQSTLPTTEDEAGGEEGQKILYGKQPTQPVAGADPKEDNDPRKAYDEFMKREDMKKFYQDDVQKVINRRFKDQKQMEERLSATDGIIEKLYSKYDVDDIEALSEAIDNDDALWEDAALDMGMSVEQYKSFKQMEQRAKSAEKFMQNQERQRAAREQYQLWLNEAEEVKAKYPEFDLETELADPNFRGLLAQKNPEYRMSMTKIYEVCHMDDLMNDLAGRTKAETEKNVVDNIRARGQRPQEGAAHQNAPVVVKDDVNQLTDDDIDNIVERVRRGEKITF